MVCHWFHMVYQAAAPVLGNQTRTKNKENILLTSTQGSAKALAILYGPKSTYASGSASSSIQGSAQSKKKPENVCCSEPFAAGLCGGCAGVVRAFWEPGAISTDLKHPKIRMSAPTPHPKQCKCMESQRFCNDSGASRSPTSLPVPCEYIKFIDFQ